ncbi:MAG: hypothetical protein KME28_03925 [Pelatocladus maniniholoensis HA4357-MV3]|uniref:Uncharacterized protein n=1 Tax=Pelatocladus maniniholoensis HA4357-MV3 TaxID=1117104 RepID=A0A9E3H537_9NOST|nr:hypothetical protein [Pelatocladus maniniholoensis HA4357-MV3]
MRTQLANGGFDPSFAHKLACRDVALLRLYIWWNDEKSLMRDVTPDSPAASSTEVGNLSNVNISPYI